MIADADAFIPPPAQEYNLSRAVARDTNNCIIKVVNEPLGGLFRVYKHMRGAIPRLVHQQTEWLSLARKIQANDLDLQDGLEQATDLVGIEPQLDDILANLTKSIKRVKEHQRSR